MMFILIIQLVVLLTSFARGSQQDEKKEKIYQQQTIANSCYFLMQEKMIKDKKIINFETKAITDDYIEDIANKIKAQLMVMCAERLSYEKALEVMDKFDNGEDSNIDYIFKGYSYEQFRLPSNIILNKIEYNFLNYIKQIQKTINQSKKDFQGEIPEQARKKKLSFSEKQKEKVINQQQEFKENIDDFDDSIKQDQQTNIPNNFKGKDQVKNKKLSFGGIKNASDQYKDNGEEDFNEEFEYDDEEDKTIKKLQQQIKKDKLEQLNKKKLEQKPLKQQTHNNRQEQISNEQKKSDKKPQQHLYQMLNQFDIMEYKYSLFFVASFIIASVLVLLIKQITQTNRDIIKKKKLK